MELATDRMTVDHVMHRGIVTCDVTTSLSKIAQMMARHRIHCVVVRKEESLSLWGVVSDLDLVGAFAQGQPRDPTAGKVAATPAVTVGTREPLRRAAQLMTDHGVTHVVVVERSGRPVGVLSTLDVARVVADAWAEGARYATPRAELAASR